MRDIQKKIAEIKADLSREIPIHDKSWYQQNAFLIDYDAIRNGEYALSERGAALVAGLEEEFRANIQGAKIELTSEFVGDTRERGGHRNLKDLLLGKLTDDYAMYDLYTLKFGPYQHQFVIAHISEVEKEIDGWGTYRHRSEVSLEDAKFNKQGTQEVKTLKFEDFAAPGYNQPEPDIVIFPSEIERYQTAVKENVLAAFEQVARTNPRFGELAADLGLRDAITVCALENENPEIANKEFNTQQWSELLHKINAQEYKWYNNGILAELNEIWESGNRQEALDFIATIDRHHALTNITLQDIHEKEVWAQGICAEIINENIEESIEDRTQ